ncbi:MAG: TerB family tellurite resistance protein [Thermodesulfovibrionales bacterium]|nr:TerB family tellurite resistance protein [Thermodesulfovibrionales bacterium]
MFGILKKAMGLEGPGPGGGESRGPRIEVAACVVLLEAAYADYKCTEDELEHVVATMKDIFGITAPQARELVEMAHKEREHAADVYGFTREINETFPLEEKLKVLEALWKVIYSDGVIEKHEAALARKVVHLLRLERKEAYEVKMNAKKWAQERA